MNTILVADDEPEVRGYLGVALGCRGYDVQFAENGNEVLEQLGRDTSDISLVLLDLLMPYMNGLETLGKLKRIRPDLPVIILSGASSPVNIVMAIKEGAADFLPKPVSHDDLATAIQKALPRPPEAASELPALSIPEPVFPVVGNWSQKLDLLIRRIGTSDVPVLLQGETGVGKEVLARRLHAKSARAGKPFLKLNCAALPSELVESELFGYERGAFTGAFKNTPGKFEMADQGTILLDEIGDMDFRLQAKLLQVVQDHEFLRLGAKDTCKVDVRVMAATHCNLEQAIADGRFREDLYYRLNIIDIHIPPLRNRQEEIIPLAEFFIQSHATQDKPALAIPELLRDALLEHQWPGNIRELENVMRKFLVLRNAELIAEDLFRRAHRRNVAFGGTPQADYNATGGREADHIRTALKLAHGNSRKAAEILHMDHATLLGRMAALCVAGPNEGASISADAETPADDASVLKSVQSAHKAAEAEAITAALNATLWNRKHAAALLKIDYKALLYKMKKLGIGEKKTS
jgi:two-component system response regulator AtoC